jgi:hypothetical protein
MLEIMYFGSVYQAQHKYNRGEGRLGQHGVRRPGLRHRGEGRLGQHGVRRPGLRPGNYRQRIHSARDQVPHRVRHSQGRSLDHGAPGARTTAAPIDESYGNFVYQDN